MQDAAPQVVNREQIREQIREAIRDAQIDRQADAGEVIVGPVGTPMTGMPPDWGPRDMPQRVQETALAFFFTIAVIFIGFPIARALARRIDRAGERPKVPAEVTAQLAQLNQAVESIAIEVERISEGQRFTTKLLTEQKLPAMTRDIS